MTRSNDSFQKMGQMVLNFNAKGEDGPKGKDMPRAENANSIKASQGYFNIVWFYFYFWTAIFKYRNGIFGDNARP